MPAPHVRELLISHMSNRSQQKRLENFAGRKISPRRWRGAVPDPRDVVLDIQVKLLVGRLTWDPERVDYMPMLIMNIKSAIPKLQAKRDHAGVDRLTPAALVNLGASSGRESAESALGCKQELAYYERRLASEAPALIPLFFAVADQDAGKSLDHARIAAAVGIPIKDSRKQIARLRELLRRFRSDLERGR
jgi:hypothetical protein